MSGLPLNIDIQQILLHLLNFSILAIGLYLLLYKPVKDFMDKRAAHYASMDKAAADKLAAAEETKEKYEQMLKNADDEIASKHSEAEKAMAAEKASEIEAAKTEAKSIIDKARADAGREKEKMISEAQAQISEMASEAAEKLVMASQSAAFDSFLDETERSL